MLEGVTFPSPIPAPMQMPPMHARTADLGLILLIGRNVSYLRGRATNFEIKLKETILSTRATSIESKYNGFQSSEKSKAESNLDLETGTQKTSPVEKRSITTIANATSEIFCLDSGTKS